MPGSAVAAEARNFETADRLGRDDGRIESFTGYRVQHTAILGPTKGGIRYAPGVSMGECAALALWMSLKCALIGLP